MSLEVPTDWQELQSQPIVLDLSSPYVVLGTLVQVQRDFLELESADVHDLRDNQSTRELYVRQSAQLGINANRHKVWIRRDEVVAIARLADIIVE